MSREIVPFLSGTEQCLSTEKLDHSSLGLNIVHVPRNWFLLLLSSVYISEYWTRLFRALAVFTYRETEGDLSVSK